MLLKNKKQKTKAEVLDTIFKLWRKLGYLEPKNIKSFRYDLLK